MAIKRAQAVLLIALALAAAGILLIARRNRTPPFLPNDAEHAVFAGADRCLSCHGPQGPLPQSERHPIGRDCTRCHVTRPRG